MAPTIIDMTESEYNARFGGGVSPEPQLEPAAAAAASPIEPVIIDMPESEYRARYGSVLDNAIAGVADSRKNLLSAPSGLYNTVTNTGGAVKSLVTGAPATPEQMTGLRNFGSLAAATSGALALGKAGAVAGTYFGPWGTAIGGVGGGALGGALGLLGIDWFAEKQGVDAPRTTQERVNSLAYNTTGGVAGDLMLRGAGAAAKGMVAPYKAIATDAGRAQAAANVLRDAYGENAIGNIQTGIDDLKGNPLREYRTTGELLGTEKAAQLQKQLEQSGLGEPIGEKNIAREAARKDLLENMAPAEASIEDVQRTVSNEIDNLRFSSRAVDNVMPANIDPTAAGSGIREIAEKLYGVNREGVKDAFADIPQKDAKRFAPTADLQTSVERLKEYFGPGSEGAPKDIQRLVDTLAPAKKVNPELDATQQMLSDIRGAAEPRNPLVDMNYLQRLRRWAGEEAQKRFNKGENRSGSVAQAVVKDIDQGLAQAVQDGTMPAEQAAAYRNALKAHADMASTFEQGPVGRILRRGEGTTGYNIEPSNVGRQFWNSNPEAMQNFGKALGGNAQAEQLLVRDAVTDFRKSTTGADGSINPTAVKKWMDNHEAFLNSFPALKDDISSIYRNEAKAALREKNFGRFVEANPEQAASVLMEGKDSIAKVQKLKQQIGTDPAVMAGLGRGVIDRLTTKLYNISGLKAKANTYKNFMDSHKGFMTEVFTPNGMKVLDNIYGDLASETLLDDLATRAAARQSATGLNVNLAQKLKNDIMAEFGLAGKVIEKAPVIGGGVGSLIGLQAGYSGAGVGGYVGSWLGGKIAGMAERAQSAALAELAKAAADPKTAQLLLLKATPENVSAIKKILEPKLSPIRQMLVSAAVINRTDTAKAAESLGKVMAPEYITQPMMATAPSKMQDLAAALSQKGAKAVPQPLPPLTIPAEKPAMKKDPTPKADTNLDAPSAIDERLVNAVAMQESSNRADAVGPKTKYGQAKGRMQLLDSTGQEMHKKLGLQGQYDPFNAEQNTKIGTAYLKELADRYYGSVPLALASYNWGMGNVDKAISKLAANGPKTVQAVIQKEMKAAMAQGLSQAAAKRAAAASVVETFGPSVLDDYLPDETRNYVSKILNRYNRTSNKVVRA